jgi:hypothetical protein
MKNKISYNINSKQQGEFTINNVKLKRIIPVKILGRSFRVFIPVPMWLIGLGKKKERW